MTAEPLALRGKRSFTTLVRAGREPLMMLPVRWQGGGEVVAHYRPRAGGLGDLHLSLPRATPPGTYEATIALPEGERTLVLEVEPQPRLSFHPRGLAWPESCVTAMNEGNATVVIPKSAEVELYARDARFFERALRERQEGEHVLDRIFDGLAGTFAGTLRLTVERGDGPLAPDEARELALAFALPEGLAAGTTYEGDWNLDGGSLAISVRTEESK